MKYITLILLFPFWVAKVIVLFLIGIVLFVLYALMVIFSIKSVEEMSDFFRDWLIMTFRYFE